MSKFHILTIKEIKRETQNAVSILFDIPTGLQNEFQFKAGQYINIKKTIAGKELRRAYSICSAPNSNQLRVAVKAVDNGTFSVFANTILKVGDTLEVQKPEGKFVLETAGNNTKNYLAIAAGSGITPIMAMLKATLNEEPNSTFTLIYGNKTVADTIFKDEINALQKSFPTNLIVQYVYSQEKQENALFGRIDKGNINYVVKNKLKNITFDDAFLCGPEAMIQLAIDVLIENNIEKNNIYFELFSTPITSEEKATQNFEGTSEITVVVDDEETTFNMDAKTSILSAALKEGLDAPYSCQGGICSSCLAKVTEGTAKMEKNAILSDSEIAEGLILTCQAHPTSQKITVDYDDV
ncbi:MULTISPECIES: 2Fe-2S iron-sulfur cluster-binding protein [Flavobacteriaceae]|uniref:2Fe-2S iron-sulfur cluster binding domain-containing protein n=2 Tax=Flavobacteriaceae TaxID=49546 RepID=A0A4Y8AR89_9FLAO|nr:MULTISPECIES: 2Fe-2S iron-sulfur cluster-binding protein [Flavobacteriaceae]TEW73715.1 2Fe-2S iron-sulfur cluster binding domain-containing protein [Gramella jeungdoensis]GGK36966.1 flavodoxin reductase [Lutibacter litoralis]